MELSLIIFLNRAEGEGRVGKIDERGKSCGKDHVYWSEFLYDRQIQGSDTVHLDYLSFHCTGESGVIVDNQCERIGFVETEIVTKDDQHCELSQMERKSRSDGQSIE
jgi:hypothetical protein